VFRGTFLVAGYPFALTESDVVAQQTNTGIFGYTTLINDGERDARDKAAPLLLEYPEQGLRESSGEAITVPHPRGLSGCGIWRLSETPQAIEWNASDVKLVGIQHRWRPERR
jgi:hypothetical protein